MPILKPAMERIIDMNHESVLLSRQMDREAMGTEFAEYEGAVNGRASVSIRKMVSIASRM